MRLLADDAMEDLQLSFIDGYEETMI